MVNTLPVILLISTALGFLSGLGIGGGSLLIIWLTVVPETDPQTARLINLLFFLPAGLIACGLRIRKGTLRPKPLLPAIAAGCASAAILSAVSKAVDTGVLKQLFGVFLLLTGLRELFYRPRKAR